MFRRQKYDFFVSATFFFRWFSVLFLGGRMPIFYTFALSKYFAK
jgi:hypothetical protein